MARVSRQSSGITRLIDVYEDRNYVYIVMGLNEGGDLEELLEVCSLSASSISTAVVDSLHNFEQCKVSRNATPFCGLCRHTALSLSGPQRL